MIPPTLKEIFTRDVVYIYTVQYIAGRSKDTKEFRVKGKNYKITDYFKDLHDLEEYCKANHIAVIEHEKDVS